MKNANASTKIFKIEILKMPYASNFSDDVNLNNVIRNDREKDISPEDV